MQVISLIICDTFSHCCRGIFSLLVSTRATFAHYMYIERWCATAVLLVIIKKYNISLSHFPRYSTFSKQYTCRSNNIQFTTVAVFHFYCSALQKQNEYVQA